MRRTDLQVLGLSELVAGRREKCLLRGPCVHMGSSSLLKRQPKGMPGPRRLRGDSGSNGHIKERHESWNKEMHEHF